MTKFSDRKNRRQNIAGFILALSAFAATGLASLATATAVNAGGGHQTCTRYSQKAVSQQRTNLRNDCGFTGPRWHKNRTAHYAWCRIASSEDRRSGNRIRRRKLNNCVNGSDQVLHPDQDPLVNDICHKYARGAVESQNANERRGCGFRGSKWSDSYEHHYRYCNSHSRKARVKRQNARIRALDKCQAGHSHQNANACGWYIILTCHGNRRAANRSFNDLGGPGIGGGAGTNVINTNRYDGFTNGLFCVADGPYRKRQLASEVAWNEAVPKAYVKRACRN